jgi:hypothetical protein
MLPLHLHAAESSDEECRLSLLFRDWGSFRGLKRERREADRLPSSSSEVKRYTSASPVCLMVWKSTNQPLFILLLIDRGVWFSDMLYILDGSDSIFSQDYGIKGFF